MSEEKMRPLLRTLVHQSSLHCAQDCQTGEDQIGNRDHAGKPTENPTEKGFIPCPLKLLVQGKIALTALKEWIRAQLWCLMLWPTGTTGASGSEEQKETKSLF